MLDGAPVAWWIGFHVVVVILIVFDLAVPHRTEGQTRRDSLFVLLLFTLAAGFAVWLGHVEGRQTGLEFVSGYLIELSMSIDNLFVFLLMFRSFGLNPEQQRKALLMGIVGAIVMRAVFIFAGIALLARFAWVEYVFGGVLLVAALRLLRGKKTEKEPAPARWMEQWAKRWTSPKARFILAVVTIEVVDLVFAIDSVPAVLAITHHPFVVYTSNICAILGLRALYTLLAGLLVRLRFLHFGLAAILGFVGAKMLTAKWIEVPVTVSLAFIVGVVVVATAASLLATPHGTME
jgi:tellurite resistance protein TerC